MRRRIKIRVPDDKEWLTALEAKSIVDYSLSTVRKRAKKGDIRTKSNPEHKTGYLYKREDLENLEVKDYNTRRY